LATDDHISNISKDVEAAKADIYKVVQEIKQLTTSDNDTKQNYKTVRNELR
jgi:hypothetical protein